MSDDEIAAFLAEPRTLTLVTLGPDGFPDPVAMWFVPDTDGSVWMRTYAKSQKVVNLLRDARVAALIESGSRYAELRGVQMSGTIDVVHDVDVICGIFADLMIRYEGMSSEYRASAIEGYRSKAPKQVGLHLVPARVVSWDHAKQAGGI